MPHWHHAKELRDWMLAVIHYHALRLSLFKISEANADTLHAGQNNNLEQAERKTEEEHEGDKENEDTILVFFSSI